MQTLDQIRIRKNYIKLRLIKIFRFLLFFLPILMPFYNQNNISVGQVVYLQSIFGLAVVLFEVPTGYISDKFSRSRSIQFGLFFAFLSYFFYPLVSNFWIFVILQIINAFGTCLVSGSDDALLYDSMLSLGESHDYNIQNSKVSSVGSYAESFAGVAGGLLAVYTFNYNLIAQTSAFFIGFLISLTLVEPPVHKPIHTGSYWQEIKETLKYTFSENQKLKWLVLFGSTISAMTFISVWFFQPILIQNQVKIAYFGLFWAAMNLLVGICIQFIPFLQKRFSVNQIFLLGFILCGISYISIGILGSVISLILYLAPTLARAIKSIVINHQINSIIDSHHRATILSIDSMMFRMIFAFIAPLLGFLSDLISVQYAFILSGISFTSILFVLYWKLSPHLHE